MEDLVCEINAHRGTFFSLGHIFLEAIIDCCDRKRGKERRGQREREREREIRRREKNFLDDQLALTPPRQAEPESPKDQR